MRQRNFLATIAVALAGCSPQQQGAVENTAAQAGNTVGNAAAQAGNTVENAAHRVENQARPVATQAALALSDSGVTLKVKAVLAASDKLDASGISVDTNHQVVFLTGTVPDAAQKAVAESLAKNMVSAGVKVVNQLRVRAASGNVAAGNAAAKKPEAKSTPATRF